MIQLLLPYLSQRVLSTIHIGYTQTTYQVEPVGAPELVDAQVTSDCPRAEQVLREKDTASAHDSLLYT